MSEETQEHEGTWSGLKKTLLGTMATVITAGGAWLGSTLFGGGNEEIAPIPQAPPVINITNTNQNQQQQVAPSKTVVIKEIPAVKEKPAPIKKKTEKEQLEEAPAW
jgi:hypothetical protein